MEQLTIHRNIPVKYTADLCIAGAGPAGIAAAVTAARRGVRVLLIDHLAMPGGMSTAALVPVFMPCSDGVNFLAAGFGSEVIDRLQKFAARRNFDSGLSINAEHLKRVYDDLLAESGVEPLYYTRLIDAVVESGRIEALLCNGPSGNFAIKAPIFIDATGDGTLSVIAGAPFEFGGENGEVMPSTLCSLWAGIDFAAYRAGGAFSHNDDKMLAKLEEAFQRGELSVPDFHHTGVFRVSNVAAVGNITHVFDVDATDERSLTRGVIENRRLLAEYEEFYRRQVAGFAEAESRLRLGAGHPGVPPDSGRLRAQPRRLRSAARLPGRDRAIQLPGGHPSPAAWQGGGDRPQETVPLLLLRQGGKLRHPLPDPAAARRGEPAHLRPMRQLRPSCDGVAPGDPGLLHHRPGSRHGGSTRCGCRNCSAQDRHRRAPERTSWNRRIFSLRKEGLRHRAALALARYFF